MDPWAVKGDKYLTVWPSTIWVETMLQMRGAWSSKQGGIVILTSEECYHLETINCRICIRNQHIIIVTINTFRQLRGGRTLIYRKAPKYHIFKYRKFLK